MLTLDQDRKTSKDFADAVEDVAPALNTTSNEGTFAWLRCAGTFCLFFIPGVWSTPSEYYEKSSLSSISPESISWIESLQAFLFVFGGVFTGPLYDKGYLKMLVRTGSFLVVLGLVTTSFCSDYWQYMLAQGLLTGLGSSMFFVPSMALLPTYFASRRALSMGIAITGGNIGGIVYSVIFRNLLPKVGFRWTTRVIALIMLVTLTLPSICLKMRLKPAIARKMFDTKTWTEAPFLLFAASCLFGLIGLYIPYFYMDSFAREKGLAESQTALYFLPIMNAGSFVGRLILCYIADRTGPVTILVFCALMSAVSAFAWIAVDSLAGMMATCIFYGCFSGTYLSLIMTTVVVTLCPDLGALGMRIDMACIPCSTGLLIGSPIGGATVKHGWLGLQLLVGITLAISTSGMASLRIMKVGWQFSARC